MRRPLLWVCLCLVLLAAFVHRAGDSPTDGIGDGQRILVTGRIYQKYENSFYLKIQSIAAGSRQENSQTIQKINQNIFSGSRLSCEYENAEGLRLGSIVVLQGEFDRFSPATNPGEFDYRRYYRSLGFAGRLREVEIVSEGERYSRLLEALYRLKRYWKERLYRVFPEKEASVMTAVLLGDKRELDSGIKELYQNNGIIHILSISGLHITIIGLGLYRLLRRLGLPVWPAAILGGAVLLLYGVLTGLSVSTCRAIGMYLLRMLALLCGRTYDMLTALGVMAAVLVCGNPGYLEHMGFLLSFGSILGVGVLCPAITPLEEEAGPVKRYYAEGKFQKICVYAGRKAWIAAKQGMLAGASITLTTLPIQLWFSYEVPVYSVILNVAVLPFMGVVMTAGLIAMLVPGLGFVGTVDILILGLYERLCLLFEKLPFRMWNPGRPAVWKIVLYYLLWLAVVWGTDAYRQARRKRRGKNVTGEGGVSAALSRLREDGIFAALFSCLRKGGIFAALLSRPRIVLGIKILALTVSVILLGTPVFQGSRVTFLDVGQGDCICVRPTADEVYLFDCGSSSRSKIGERVLIPFLKYYGIRHVDGVFLSHPDADHMNGLLELLALGEKEQITVGQVILPALEEGKREEEFAEILAAVRAAPQREAIEVRYVQAGDELWAGRGASQMEEDVSRAEDSASWVMEGISRAEDSASRVVKDASRAEDGLPGRFVCLHPAADFPSRETNASSGCFYMKFASGYSLLLTGDVEGEGETALLQELRRQGISDVTLLKVPHHGSRYSTSEELLAQVSPAAAVISCGRNNRYGHPHAELLERLEQTGGYIFRTDESGAITVDMRKKKIIVRAFCE